MRLAADANVLLSALIGGQAKRVFSHPAVSEILTTESVIEEVQEYTWRLVRKRGLKADLTLLAAASFPVTVIPRLDYAPSLREARKRIGRRDPGDAELLALAIRFEIPVWSNDRDFQDAGVAWYTTAALLAVLDRG